MIVGFTGCGNSTSSSFVSGLGFSHADKANQIDWALAPEGRFHAC
jgi:hypothetical protein